jgi:hypothetical protein
MYLARELPYLSPPDGVGAFADAILSARNKRLWLTQLGISYADTLRKLIEDHETLGTAQFNQMAIRKRGNLDSHMAAINDIVERGMEAAESGVNAKLVEQLRQAASMLEQFSWRQSFGGSPTGQQVYSF